MKLIFRFLRVPDEIGYKFRSQPVENYENSESGKVRKKSDPYFIVIFLHYSFNWFSYLDKASYLGK